jgi:acyl-coenzyme A thioesterase PaaI-like protein
VTAEYSVRFLRPSPIDREWKLSARTLKLEGDRATVSGELRVGGKVTASMTGTFVAVHRGHPAYYRWH